MILIARLAATTAHEFCPPPTNMKRGGINSARHIREKCMPNQFFWHELITTDTRAAQGFYGDVVGWTAQEAADAGP